MTVMDEVMDLASDDLTPNGLIFAFLRSGLVNKSYSFALYIEIFAWIWFFL